MARTNTEKTKAETIIKKYETALAELQHANEDLRIRTETAEASEGDCLLDLNYYADLLDPLFEAWKTWGPNNYGRPSIDELLASTLERLGKRIDFQRELGQLQKQILRLKDKNEDYYEKLRDRRAVKLKKQNDKAKKRMETILRKAGVSPTE